MILGIIWTLFLGGLAGWIAGKLMEAAVEQIREQGGNIRATCSYAVVWLDKNPQDDMSVETPNGLSCRIR